MCGRGRLSGTLASMRMLPRLLPLCHARRHAIAAAQPSPHRPPSMLPPTGTCSTQADTVKAFLAASAEGFRYAAANPAEAAALFVQAATAAHPNLPQPLEEGMCRESLQYVAKVGVGRGLGSGPWSCTLE